MAAGPWLGVLGIVTALWLPPIQAAERSGVVSRVIDGDSIELSTDRGQIIEVRLFGIDAPEHDQPFGDRAEKLLASMALGQRVLVPIVGYDRYQRALGCPQLDDENLCVALVEQGAAWVFEAKDHDEALLAAQNTARKQRVGLWAQPAGDIKPPWVWRARPESSSSAPRACAIKGNINRRGQRIYHLPGQRHYAQTGISGTKGERWFCSESEAQAAGWRKSRR